MALRFAALLAVALTFGSGVAWADDSDDTDSQFIATLQARSIPFDSAEKAVTEANAVCAVFQQGKSFEAVTQGLIAAQPSYNTLTASTFVQAASKFYCPSYLRSSAH